MIVQLRRLIVYSTSLVQPSLATGGTAAGLGGWGAGLATLTDWVTDSGLQ